MSKEIFQIDLNTEVLDELRNKVNEEQYISYNKRHGNHRAWDKICAIMDRLDDTVLFLNALKLNTGKHTRSAFDFFNFMNNASVVVECIKELAKIFNVPEDQITKSVDTFNQLGNDGKGTDERYFKYLRSLCSVHPVETSHHQTYQDNDFECSPFVVWNNQGIYNDDCDIYVVVYTSKDGDLNKRIPIYMSQIFEYVKSRLDFVKEITSEIAQYQKKVISNFIKRPIKMKNAFEDYIDYLENLNKEIAERYGSEYTYRLDYIIKLFSLKLSNSKNKDKMSLYLNSLKYSIEFLHNSMQNMSLEGFENTGLLYSGENVDASLYDELYVPHSGSDEKKKFSYNFEKIHYLKYDSGYNNKQWAYIQLENVKIFLEKYVSFHDTKSDFEHYALVNLALYLECLEKKCLINKNIPNDFKYRERLLFNNELEELFYNK
ncbi:hypothetical protein GH741_20975 [Aquibacillus halophilus]|uniref:Uncharacterized protein n=1 Tax=Aquibacillus halophilus TaxID=930132 RepID=A0A6A8DMW7_9BACI|nr:hypothetical protein [Aquibacillus halophilus]MRH45119.1 hypothetical protein [Aquibacillus halophilus]